MARIKNLKARQAWIRKTLAELPAGLSILDVGAGECQYKDACGHLNYKAQDIAQYDGQGNAKGLQTQTFDFHKLDFECDLYDIPEDEKFDAILCTEVLEHVTDPVKAMEKISRLVTDDGILVVTAPFYSWTHFAPYHYATGFSEYFFNEQMQKMGFEIEDLEANGGYFDLMDQEIGRVASVRRRYGRTILDPISYVALFAARMSVRMLAALDGPRNKRKSSELATMGWHMKAQKKAA